MKILFLDIPALRLGYLGCYGNDWVATPNLDRLASEGIVFDRHYAGCRQDLCTGRHDFPMPGDGAGETSDRAALEQSFAPLGIHLIQSQEAFDVAQTIKAILYQVDQTSSQDPCLIWAELPSLAPPWNLAADMLDAYFEDGADAGPWPDPPQGFLGGDRGRYLERLQNTYAAVATYVDAEIGAFMHELTERRTLDQWLLCITSRIGLPLGEHGFAGYHRAWQHEELTHLPLLLRLPGAERAGLRIPALTQTVDIVPTLRELLGLPQGNVHGQSLQPLIREEVSDIRPFACSGASFGDSCEWSLRTLEWSLLLPLAGDLGRNPQLYVKPDDPWEVNDVHQHHLERMDEMEKALRDFVCSTRP